MYQIPRYQIIPNIYGVCNGTNWYGPIPDIWPTKKFDEKIWRYFLVECFHLYYLRKKNNCFQEKCFKSYSFIKTTITTDSSSKLELTILPYKESWLSSIWHNLLEHVPWAKHDTCENTNEVSLCQRKERWTKKVICHESCSSSCWLCIEINIDHKFLADTYLLTLETRFQRHRT